MESNTSAATLFLSPPDGRVAYHRDGSGPIVVLVPGMGDLRQTYRHVAPALVADGWTVVCTDLRGHGDSDATFESYGADETADDLLSLIEQLGEPALLVGNSMAAGSSVIVAATRPDLVSGLVLIGPFVRDAQGGRAVRLLMRVLMAPAWAALVWRFFLPSLYAGAKPVDFDAYRGHVFAALRRRGYASAFSRTTRTTQATAQAMLGRVQKPALVVMGEKDPDFPDPRSEAEWIGEQLAAEVVIVPDAGHYPHSQQPEAVLAALRPFARRVAERG